MVVIFVRACFSGDNNDGLIRNSSLVGPFFTELYYVSLLD